MNPLKSACSNSKYYQEIALKYITFFILLILGSLVISFGCGNNSQQVSTPSAPIPNHELEKRFIQHPAKDMDYYYFYGMATEIPKREDAESQARANAYEKISSTISNHVQASFEQLLQTSGNEDNEEIYQTTQSKIQTHTDSIIQSVIVVDSELVTENTGKFSYFILVQVPKEQIERSDKVIIQGYMEQARMFYTQGNIQQALLYYDAVLQIDRSWVEVYPPLIDIYLYFKFSQSEILKTFESARLTTFLIPSYVH